MNMKNTLLAFLLLPLIGGLLLFAQEHPDEHPDDDSNQEHPQEKQKKQQAKKKQFLKAVEDYVDMRTEGSDELPADGIMPVQTLDGEFVDVEGDLSLEKLHRKKAVQYDDHCFFVCADFVAEDDDGNETTYDFDFYIVHKNGNWNMGLVLLHKKQGEEVIEYVDNKPQPVDEEGESDTEHPDSGGEHPDDNGGSEHPD